MSTKKLIVNADDFGQSDGINRGIIRAYEKGILTSASLMVRYPAAAFAADYCKQNKLGLGLHIDLGEWIFTDENWIPVYEVIALSDVNMVAKEIRNQLSAFIKLVGRNPTHIDSHQHVHQRASLKPAFIDIARKLNVTLRGCSKYVNYCGNFYGQSSDSTPLLEMISVSNLKHIVNTLPEGITEMACHPGLDVEIQTMYKKERETEVASLCDKGVRESVKLANVELCSFSGIPF